MKIDPREDPAVELVGVAKRYGWKPALRAVDLRLERGGRLALVGPNGAGKTTLLKIVAGLVRPTAGRVRVLGFALPDGLYEVRRRLAFLAPRDYLYDELTAEENLRFACRMSGVDAGGERLAAVLDRVDLGAEAETRVGGFSSGMRKRLAVARLLLRPPRVALLDEPYASLDARGVELVDGLVDDLRAEGATVILASHQWGRSLREADSVLGLRDGRVAWRGPPAEYSPGLLHPAGRGTDGGGEETRSSAGGGA